MAARERQRILHALKRAPRLSRRELARLALRLARRAA